MSLARWETGARPVPATVIYLARLLVLTHIPLQTFIPDDVSPDEPMVHIEPGDGPCRWRGAEGVACAGSILHLICQLSRRRHLVATACRQHLWPAYEAVEARIITKIRAERHRQNRLLAKREARRKAREGTVLPVVP